MNPANSRSLNLINTIMELKDFYYSETSNYNDYFDFSKGLPCTETEVNMFIQECIDSIKKQVIKHPDRESYFHHISTGNTKVIVECYRQGSCDTYTASDKFTIYVNVATAYKQCSKCDIEIPQIAVINSQ